VQGTVGFAIDALQRGRMPGNAKPLKGFGGFNVIQISEDCDTDTYRAFCTVRFKEVVYLLHCLQKKSKTGIDLTKQDKKLIEQRLKWAVEKHKEDYKGLTCSPKSMPK